MSTRTRPHRVVRVSVINGRGVCSICGEPAAGDRHISAEEQDLRAIAHRLGCRLEDLCLSCRTDHRDPDGGTTPCVDSIMATVGSSPVVARDDEEGMR